MKLDISEKNASAGSSELFLKGELTIYSVAALNERMNSLLKRGQKIDINLAGVEKIDTAGFQILVSALKSGKKISILKSGDEVKKIFGFYGEKI